MDMSITQITSGDSINIEQHFRVSAGPGAGKTYWLVEHIKNILHNSQRLKKTRKIACITYTNVAVETILKRLDSSSNRVEVSTIHGFLYKNVVKPYISFIADEFEFDVEKLDGHDDHNASFSKVSDWIRADFRSLRYLFADINLAASHLESLSWKFDGEDLIQIVTRRSGNFNSGGRTFSFLGNDKQDHFLNYKKLYWNDGILHHEDVLFFSYELIKRFPFILTVLRAKFPYFFVDEFQDTNPIQTEILRQIGQEETIVGVIGDKAQSIYGFQGAMPAHFDLFDLPDIQDYQMVDNRRSTNQNIDLLNCIRPDFLQNKIRNQEGDNPRIIVGEMNSALQRCQEICGDEEVYSLTYRNVISNSLKRELNGLDFDRGLKETLSETDSPNKNNGYRSNVIIQCITAAELANECKFKDAIRELERIFREIKDKNERRKTILKVIHLLLQKRNEFENKPLTDFHAFTRSEIKDDISDLRAGAAKDFYDAHTYQQIALCIKIKDDDSLIRTIHGAKGDEFNNVLLVLGNENRLNFLISPDLNNERHRIYYVAVSRARERIFINTPNLSPENEGKLRAINLDVIRL